MVILTSDNEGTPLSLIQAGMANLPVIATDVGSISEIVVDGSTGLLTDLSTTALTQALEKLIAVPSLRHQMGNKAKAYTMERYGVQRLVRDHQDLYLKLLNN